VPTIPQQPASRRDLTAVALVSGTLLMTELALTRIFSVVMYYHFAFLAISIALFGLSASGVFAYLARRWLDRSPASFLLARQAAIYAACTIVALFVLVRLRVGLNYSPRNLELMLIIYALAALPFFAGGLVITIAISRFSSRINAVYAADLMGAAGGCLVLLPLLDRLGAPGVVLTAAALALIAAVLFAPPGSRARFAGVGAVVMVALLAGQLSGVAAFDVTATKGHAGDRILFSKWNSFSRIGVYERTHGDWSLSSTYTGKLPDTRYMDIDSAASTPILHVEPDLSNVQYLRYELTALAYHLKERRLEAGGWRLGGTRGVEDGDSRVGGTQGLGAGGSAVGPSPAQPLASSLQPQASSLQPPSSQPPGFTALVIGPGGGRDLVSALVFGARQVDGVEINPIIADDVMRNRFREYSGGIYTHPRVRIVIDDGRSFIRRTPDRYDIIQASLVDTWAATAAGAYTLTENTLYTVEAFNDYLDHLTDDGVLTITRWVLDGLRLISLAQAACESRGWDAAPRLAIVQHDRVATFLLKKTPLTAGEVALLKTEADRLGFRVLYAPTVNGTSPALAPDVEVDGVNTGVYAKLIRAPNRAQFYAEYEDDVSPTTDDRPFYFHITKLKDQFQVAFGRSMLFGNGLSALLTLTGISAALVVLFVVGPLAVAGGPLPRGWFGWLAYFGALGAGFMLIEVSVLQRFVLLLGHPVYSLTVTLFSLLLGTGVGAAWSRRVKDEALARSAALAVLLVAAVAVFIIAAVTPVISWAIPFARATRIAIAVGLLAPIGMLLGIPMPTGLRLLQARAPEMVTWAWGINGALSVLGATLAIFIAMNWGFRATLLAASATYLMGFVALRAATSR
jgi:spermidine synthase